MATRLLMIDPDITFMVNVRQALEETGEFEVTISANGMAAQDALLRRRYDVAVIDFNVPDMDVLELIALLRQVQPGLPVIMCPRTASHQDRIRFMDIQGAIQKPYIARDLIPYVRSVLTRERARREKAAPPEIPEALRRLVPPEKRNPTPTELLDQVEHEKLDQAFPQGNDLLAELDSIEEDQGQTKRLPEEPEQAATELLEWQEVDQTSRLAETDLLEQQGGGPRDTKPLDPRPGEPPRHPEDTPAVPHHDLPSMRQFLATQPPTEDASAFGEVLDAVARAPLTEPKRSDVDRAFQDLVDSMRTPESPRHTLEDLLNSIAADAAQQAAANEAIGSTDEALDFVLDAIRRGESPHESDESDLYDDRTIGDVLNDLFDPSFEGVLAALAGEEIDEKTFEEPTYTQEGLSRDLGAVDSDQYAFEDMAADEDTPEWLSDYEHDGVEPLPEEERRAGPVIDEPPVSSEDSSHYPATTALNAITSLEKDDFSLNLLLEQIEQQLPPAKSKRPRLKPLPSWKKDSTAEGARQLEAMFDHLERPSSSSAPAISEPDHTRDDTRPSSAVMDEIERTPVQDADTSPTNLELLDEVWPDEAEATPLYSVADLLSEPDLRVEPDDEDIAEAFYAGIQEPEETQLYEEDDTYTDLPDDEHLVAVPVASFTQFLQEEEPEEETTDDQLAQIAVQLTQFSLESSAQATLLARPGELLAQAGELAAPAMERLFQVVDSAWHTSPPESGALVRYIRLPEMGEFLLYSTYVMDDLILSMAFHANTSMRMMRRQAQRLSESLAFVPEGDESEAASTLPNRPTDLRPPAGLREAVHEPEFIEEAEDFIEEAEEPVRPPRPEGPYAAYTCLWLPRDPGLEMVGSFADELYYWIGDIAEENAWDIDSLDVRSDYVMVSLHVPHKTLPDSVIDHLMDETTRRCAEYYPDRVREPLWADGYYVVTPPRTLTEREIARFITYQRQAQL